MRGLPLAGGLAVAAAAVALTAVGGSGEACAQSSGAVAPRIACPGSTTPPPPQPGTRPMTAAPAPAACRRTTALVSGVRARRSGRGLRVTFRRRPSTRITLSVFQSATRRAVVGERLVFRTTTRRDAVRWSGRRQRGRRAPRDGVFFVRVTARRGGAADVRRVALRRKEGRFAAERRFARRDGCGAVRAFKLERPAFGGRANRAVSVSFRLAFEARATVELRRGGRVVRRLSSAVRRGGVLHRVRLASERLRRGRYEVRLRFGTATSSLFIRKV